MRMPRTFQPRALVTPETLAASIVCAAVFFNMVLAFLNANVLAVDRGMVVAVEAVLVAAALGVCVVYANRLMIPWVAVFWVIGIIFVALSVGRQSIEPKYFRDVLLIPTFIALGMTFAKGNIFKVICTLQAIIFAVMLFEALAPTLFAEVFNPWDYYVSTRENIGTDSWHGYRLYLSSFRPGGRLFFSDLDVHRLSSVFLEPVSLGNWCVVTTIYIVTLWRSMPLKVRAFLVVSQVIILVGSDGRFAMMASLLIVVLTIAAEKLPRYVYVFYLPVIAALSIVLVTVFGFGSTADDFPGRIGRSVAVMASLDLHSYLGLNAELIGNSADSGISYFILTQSLIGVGVLWLAICFLQPANNHPAVVLMHGICLYLSLLLMVSYSLFSIKTAAPLWFLYGYVRAKGYQEGNLAGEAIAHSQQLRTG